MNGLVIIFVAIEYAKWTYVRNEILFLSLPSSPTPDPSQCAKLRITIDGTKDRLWGSKIFSHSRASPS
jgi:hypothetical protein